MHSTKHTRRRGALRAVAVAFPESVRRNSWWEDHHPALVANAREATLAKLWDNFADPSTLGAYDRAFAPYLRDPWRGTVERRVMGPEDTARSLSARAIREAMEAGGYGPDDIDLILVNALRPDSHVVGDAAFLVGELGLRAPAIDFETACSSALVGLHLASDLIAAGRYERVLVVTCCTYTRDVDQADSFSWFLGDGAGAMIVEAVEASPAHEGLLAAHTIPTVETCGAFAYHLELVDGAPALRIVGNKKLAGRSIRDHSERYLRTCVDGALSEAGVSLSEVDFLVCNTPTAWYGPFCADVLGFEGRFVDNYPRFANCGPALWPNNLHTALSEGRVRPGDLVLGYSIGSVSTACAVLLRVGEVAVGSQP